MGSIQKSSDYFNNAKLGVIFRKIKTLEPFAVKLREPPPQLQAAVKRDIDPTPFGSNAIHMKHKNNDTSLSSDSLYGSGQMLTFQQLQRMKRSGILNKAINRFEEKENNEGGLVSATQTTANTPSASLTPITNATTTTTIPPQQQQQLHRPVIVVILIRAR